MAESTEQRAARFDQAARQERVSPPEMIQKEAANRHPDQRCYIAKVDSNATGGGHYNCYLQSLDPTKWNTSNVDQLSNVGDTVVVLNLHEIPITGDTGSHALSAGDVIKCFKFIDDEGTARLIGHDVLRNDAC